MFRFNKIAFNGVKKSAAALALMMASLVPLAVQGQFPSRNEDFRLGADMADQEPIHWSARVQMKSKTEGMIVIKATVANGWHLYGTSMPEGGPRPTRFIFPRKAYISFKGEMHPSVAPVSKNDPMFGGEIQQWDGDVVFTRSFRLRKDAPANLTVPVEVEFMGCNDKTCLPPSKKTFNLRINK